jgi:NADH-quinone oxidoreductase subunit L
VPAPLTDELLVTLLLALPLAGAALTGLVGRRLGVRAWVIAVPAIILTWVIALVVIYRALTGAFGEEGLRFTLFQWIPAGDFTVDLRLAVDQLTAVLLLVVTTVGMLVHVYSIGYMAHEPGRWRFFGYLNLFMFSMLLLVLAADFLVLFAAWELVGLCSYLLIGYWYERRSAALAAKKAFITNRVGDVGFALGLMAIWTTVGTLDMQRVFEELPAAGLQPWQMTGICLLLFMGAAGKSAQFPLHVWLPDAMEGPTPVSALIHAATMVNAGVYLVARSNPLFVEAPLAMTVVAAIGIFTALLAATIALTQKDIKRVLAYSTLSQLGYMFAALGAGAYIAAIFHLVTHGFFKGLLFLGSGSVIHAVQGEQDMDRMGGLWRKLPVTHATMLIGALAISGIPFFAGFFSKDEILGEAFKLRFYWIWGIGIVVALLTAFYMFRLMGKTFYGPSHVDPVIADDVHESPPSMALPLVLLAIPSAFIGLALGWPPEGGLIHSWLGPVFEHAEEVLGHHPEALQLWGLDGFLIGASVAVAVIGLLLAAWLFGFRIPLLGLESRPRPERVERLTARVEPLYRGSSRKWYFDELNDLLFVRLGGVVANALWWFDTNVIDGTVNGIGRLTQGLGREARQIQTGHVQNYALGIAIGLLVVAVSYLLVAPGS